MHSCNVKTQICVTRPQCVNLSISMLFRILHILSILTGPNISLSICLSKMRRLFSSLAAKVQVCGYNAHAKFHEKSIIRSKRRKHIQYRGLTGPLTLLQEANRAEKKKILVDIRSWNVAVGKLIRLLAALSGVRTPTGERNFSFLQNVHTGSGAHPNF